jgi:hypothetical protein
MHRAGMTTAELVKEVLQGILVLVGEYRWSHAEMACYVEFWLMAASGRTY